MIRKIVDLIDSLNLLVGRAAKWLVLVLTGCFTYEVIMRYGFNNPTVWIFDVSYMLGGSFFVLGMGYTLLKNNHVRVDVFYSKFNVKVKAFIEIVLTLFLFYPAWGILLYRAIPYVYRSWITREKALESFWQPPIYPFKTIFLIGVILLLLQVTSELYRSLEVFFSKCGAGDANS